MTRFRSRGFTLIELLIALVISASIGGIITTILTNQHRLFTNINNTLSLRERLRDAAEILAADLRSTTVTPDAFPFASDTAIEFLSTIGASTLCQSPVGVQLFLPPDTLPSGIPLTTWITPPDSTDLVAIYYDSGAFSPTRGWLRTRIATLTSTPLSTTCPADSGFTLVADAPNTTRAYTLTLQAPPPLSIIKGAPLRFLRRSRYSVYRASDKYWYLGYRRCHPITAVCDGIQPISGPYTNTSTPPFAFRYHTPAGLIPTPNTSIPNLTRIDIIFTTPPKHKSPLSSIDSTLTIITFRNRS